MLTKQASQVGGEGDVVVVQLPPGDADHAPAFGLQDAVSLTVALEGRACAVGGTAVQFDD
jgi:hypothetical protein